MKDSDIPNFTTRLLADCKKAVREGRWVPPKEPGEFNYHCCPLMVTNEVNKRLEWDEMGAFISAYDGRPLEYGNYRFYVLGQAFRKIVDTTGFL